MNASIVAEVDGEVVGAVLAYIPPYASDTLNILQVVIRENEENKGLGSLMLGQVMRREVCAEITRVETTINSRDETSWALFRRFARWQHSRITGTKMTTRSLFGLRAKQKTPPETQSPANTHDTCAAYPGNHLTVGRTSRPYPSPRNTVKRNSQSARGSSLGVISFCTVFVATI